MSSRLTPEREAEIVADQQSPGNWSDGGLTLNGYITELLEEIKALRQDKEELAEFLWDAQNGISHD